MAKEKVHLKSATTRPTLKKSFGDRMEMTFYDRICARSLKKSARECNGCNARDYTGICGHVSTGLDCRNKNNETIPAEKYNAVVRTAQSVYDLVQHFLHTLRVGGSGRLNGSD